MNINFTLVSGDVIVAEKRKSKRGFTYVLEIHKTHEEHEIIEYLFIEQTDALKIARTYATKATLVYEGKYARTEEIPVKEALDMVYNRLMPYPRS